MGWWWPMGLTGKWADAVRYCEIATLWGTWDRFKYTQTLRISWMYCFCCFYGKTLKVAYYIPFFAFCCLDKISFIDILGKWKRCCTWWEDSKHEVSVHHTQCFCARDSGWCRWEQITHLLFKPLVCKGQPITRKGSKAAKTAWLRQQIFIHESKKDVLNCGSCKAVSD